MNTLVAGPSPTASIDVALQVAQLLVGLGALAAVILGGQWLSMVIWRERMLRKVASEFPDTADELRRTVRAVPLLRTPRAPKDPAARTHHVVVPPRGDGRPGESFWGPGPAMLADPDVFGSDGSKQDLSLQLGPGLYLLVVCMGKVGVDSGGGAILPAEERVELVRRSPNGLTPSGPVDRVETPAGTGWRSTFSAGGKMVTDTHIDHDGWGFIIGVLSSKELARAVELCDHVLETWRWLPAEPHAEESPDG